jgi:hypothetical protein
MSVPLRHQERGRRIGMRVAQSTKTFFLLRKDDVPYASDKKGMDSHLFLQKLVEGVSSKLCKDGKIKFENSFFVLGRSSLAFIASGHSLDDVPEILAAINDEHEKLASDTARLSTGSFECFAFPTVPFPVQTEKIISRPEGVIPVLFFVRTPVSVANIAVAMKSDPSIVFHLDDMCLGLGVYDLIFQMRFEDLFALRDITDKLRKRIANLWETSTVIGVPRDAALEKERARTVTIAPCLFSISLRCSNNIVTDETISKISNLTKSDQYQHLFAGMNSQDIVTYRQGYMDLELFCKSKCISPVFELACDLRKIECVIDTSSVAHIRTE